MDTTCPVDAEDDTDRTSRAHAVLARILDQLSADRAQSLGLRGLRRPSPPRIHFKERTPSDILGIPGVVAIGVGPKLVGGQPIGEVAIHILVLKKKLLDHHRSFSVFGPAFATRFATVPQLVVGTRVGGVWQFASTDPVQNPAFSGWNFDPVVVLDSQDRFNLFFRAAPPVDAGTWNEVDWWVGAGSSWTKTTAGVGGDIGSGDGYHYDVAFTAAGEVFIARVGANSSGVAYDHFDGCKWTSHQIDAPSTTGASFETWWPSVAVDPAGRPHFSFQEIHQDDHNQDELWSAEPLP